MDGIRLASRTLAEVPAFRLAAYDAHCVRMLGCSGDAAMAVMERAGGSAMWECSCSWEADCARVTQVAWAHSEFGHVVAVASSAGEVCIYEERQEGGGWRLTARLQCGACAATDCAFGPKQMGLCLAVACDDGYVRVFKSPQLLFPDDWLLESDVRACTDGAALCCTWRGAAPSATPTLLIGTERGARVWVYGAALNAWQPSSATLTKAADPVEACAWAPTLGRPCELFAVAANTEVHVFSAKGPIDALQVEEVAVLRHPSRVWQVGWNMLGNWLATSCDDAAVRLWRPDLGGTWRHLHTVQGGEASATSME